MISFVEGVLVEKQPTRAVIEAGGVGYEIFIPLSSFEKLPAANQRCRLLTYYHVREDQHVLYGFAGAAEKRLFMLLITVNGIGPKLALSVLSGLPPHQIKTAILSADTRLLSSISGIGKKTAERIIVDLRDRISALDIAGASEPGSPAAGREKAFRDAIAALVSLGFKQADASKKVHAAAAASDSVEEIVRKALTGAPAQE